MAMNRAKTESMGRTGAESSAKQGRRTGAGIVARGAGVQAGGGVLGGQGVVVVPGRVTHVAFDEHDLLLGKVAGWPLPEHTQQSGHAGEFGVCTVVLRRSKI